MEVRIETDAEGRFRIDGSKVQLLSKSAELAERKEKAAKEEKERELMEKECPICGQRGHLKRNCPQATKADIDTSVDLPEEEEPIVEPSPVSSAWYRDLYALFAGQKAKFSDGTVHSWLARDYWSLPTPTGCVAVSEASNHRVQVCVCVGGGGGGGGALALHLHPAARASPSPCPPL